VTSFHSSNAGNRTSTRRLLLKLSGESLCGPGGFGIDPDELGLISGELGSAAKAGARIALVIGGGNIIRGAELARGGQIERATADHLGMLGTIMNALALRDRLERDGTPAAVMSALAVRGVAEVFDRRGGIEILESGRVLILAGGTGNPYFTTDSCAALRAAELGCDEMLKATKVDGVYDADPVKNPGATRFETLSLTEALERGLGVMDHAAAAICRDAGIPVRVFAFKEPGNIRRVVEGGSVGTLVTP